MKIIRHLVIANANLRDPFGPRYGHFRSCNLLPKGQLITKKNQPLDSHPTQLVLI